MSQNWSYEAKEVSQTFPKNNRTNVVNAIIFVILAVIGGCMVFLSMVPTTGNASIRLLVGSITNYKRSQHVFLIFDPDCLEKDQMKCEIVLFTPETSSKVYITGQANDPDRSTKVVLNDMPRISSDGQVIGFLRSIDNGSTFSIMLSNSDGSNLRRITGINDDVAHFSFTQDSKRIIFNGAVRNVIYHSDLNGNGKEILLKAYSSDIYFKGVISTFLLRNGVLAYVDVFIHGPDGDEEPSQEYLVCMKKNGVETCFESTRSSRYTEIIPCGDVVYCVNSGESILMINTESPQPEASTISVDGIANFISGTVSKDGKDLYLTVPYDNGSSNESTEFALLKVNVEGVSGSTDLPALEDQDVIISKMFMLNVSLVSRRN